MKLFSLLLAFFQQFVSHLRPIFYPYFMGNFQSLQRGHFTAQNEEKYLMHFQWSLKYFTLLYKKLGMSI